MFERSVWDCVVMHRKRLEDVLEVFSMCLRDVEHLFRAADLVSKYLVAF